MKRLSIESCKEPVSRKLSDGTLKTRNLSSRETSPTGLELNQPDLDRIRLSRFNAHDQLLDKYCGYSMADIGSLDVSDTL